MASGGSSMKLKIYVNKKQNRVVFAEANKEFVDFIFHILALPLGAVHRILDKNTSTTILGSIGTLQDGLKKLDDQYLEKVAKDYLLGIKAPYSGENATRLLPETSRIKPVEFYQCTTGNCVRVQSPCQYHYSCSTYRSSLLGKELDVAGVQGSEKGYVKEVVTFMVMDDLEVRPAGPTSFISLMTQLSIKDVGVDGAVEKREVTFGTAQARKLLKASISSKTILTDVFLDGAVKAESFLCGLF